jgi:molybdopterin converting factor small subunit
VDEESGEMTVNVKLFGTLRNRAPGTDVTGIVGILELDGGRVKSISDILELLDLREDEVSHLFVNNDYSGPRRTISDGDAVSIFPRDMALLYKWYFSKKQ